MDMQTYYDQFENCLQEEKAFCGDDCPFHMDVLDFEDKLAAGRYNAAYKILRNATAFPDIIAKICPQYCTSRCPRNELGGAIRINMLEKTCLAETKKKDPNEYNLPARKGKIAIVGAGLSGLSCALRLASKKYEVIIYEKESSIGGQLREMLPSEEFMEEIDRQFKYENYTLHTNTEINDISQLAEEAFDAVYVATGNGGRDLGVLTCDTATENKFCYLIENTGAVCHDTTAIYGGGSLLGKDVVYAAAEGLAMAREIEGYLKTGILRYPAPAEKTKVEIDPYGIESSPAVIPADENIFTKEEAAAEIARCLRCQCDACRRYCDLTAYFDKWPLQMRDDIMTTTMPANSMIRKAPAIRLINMCTQCGLCGETCPGQIELGGMIKEARRMMHKIDRMPGAFHQFWVRDMEFANGSYASLAKCPPGKDSCEFAFFPGCHLGAANPEYVKGAYSALLKANDDVGLLLRCCGVPSDWAGNEEVHEAAINSLKADWESLGKPTMIMACPSCMRHFREYLPEVPMISIYEIFDQWDIKPAKTNDGSKSTSATENAVDAEVYAIFDPCAARNCDDMQAAVRKLLAASGVSFEELPGGDKHGCCGFGGNIEVASPKMAKKVASDRSAISNDPYITYCINCRDVFHDDGKPVRHALDILLGIEGPGEVLPTVTERRCNRVILKEKLLNEIWSETMTEKPVLKYDLIIGPEMKAKMDSLKILEEDICHVIEMGEVHGRKAFDPQKETYKCYREIGSITCWVEYKPAGEAYEVINVYTHRMKIELEVVFNGRKTDFDLR